MNEEAMLSVAKKLRQEREREKELQTQKADQRTAIQHIDQRVARMEAQLKDSRQQVQPDNGSIHSHSTYVQCYSCASCCVRACEAYRNY